MLQATKSDVRAGFKPATSTLSAHERTNRALHSIVRIGMIGGGPKERGKREEMVADLMSEAGVSRLQVEEAVRLQGTGAIKGVRNYVESWFDTVQ